MKLTKLCEALNKGGIECEYQTCTNYGWIEFGDNEGPEGNVICLCNEYAEFQNAPACTIIREALVRSGFDMNHWHATECKHFVRAINMTDLTNTEEWKAEAPTYTEALLTCMMEVWR